MSREVHVQFCEGLRGKFPQPTLCVVQCQTKEEAELLLNRLRSRLSTGKLEVHPEKTRIVYCRSEKNTERHEHETFDFLGYSFRCRLTKTKYGNFFNSFTSAASKMAILEFKEKMRNCRKQGNHMTPSHLAEMMNPIMRGWANYFMKFCPSEAKIKALYYVNFLIVNWSRRRYKRLSKNRRKAYRWLCDIAKVNSDLFYHWQLGIRPTMG